MVQYAKLVSKAPTVTRLNDYVSIFIRERLRYFYRLIEMTILSYKIYLSLPAIMNSINSYSFIPK
jgi:hypothetical protein